MDLEQATRIVLKDMLTNYQGGIPEEYLEEFDADQIVDALLRSDNFLTDFVKNTELMIAEFIEYNLW